MCLCYFQNCVFFQKFCEPLSISIDPICFLINRKYFKNVFRSLCLLRLIQTVFRSIEIILKLFEIFKKKPLFVSINRNSWIKFLKNRIWLVQTTFSKLFHFLRLGKAPQQIFCCFPPDFLQGFSVHKPVCPYYPFFCIVFPVFMHYFMIYGFIFGLCINWDFWLIKPYFVKLINGFCWYIDIFMVYDG